ncbi:hypothetical protein [Ideonella sp.]|uniref:hypothetical protein n=1 Tax=Ideonella sp. TaxID=1929293 RepID=UPI003BB7C060
MKLSIVTGILLLLSLPQSWAQSSSGRAHFEAGASAYIKGGATEAVAAWLKGSALEGNTQATSQANSLRQIEDFYGKPEGFEVVSETAVTPRVAMVLAIIYYQKGPVFARFQTYKLSSGSWVATEFKFHTEGAQLFPNGALYGR